MHKGQQNSRKNSDKFAGFQMSTTNLTTSLQISWNAACLPRGYHPSEQGPGEEQSHLRCCSLWLFCRLLAVSLHK